MFPNCYKFLSFDDNNLRILAEIYEGTIKVDEISKDYKVSWSYS